MTSMLYTIGTALSRAADHGLRVSVLVEGSWLEGQVAASDGMGVVLESQDGGHAVVRTERISAVRLHAATPATPTTPTPPHPPIGRGPEAEVAGERSTSHFADLGAARPMPGPQAAFA